MIKLVSSVGLVVATLGLVACGGSSDNGNRTAVCAKNYDPIVAPAEGSDKKKFPLKRGEKALLPVGNDFGYVSADIFYHEVENDIKIHISESQDRAGNFNSGLVCLSGKGINKDLVREITQSIPLVSDILVDDAGQVSVRHRTVNFSLAKPKSQNVGWFQTLPDTGIDKTWVPGAPSDLYGDFNSNDQSFYDFNVTAKNNVYQLISFLKKQINVGSTQDVGTLELNIRVTLKKMTPDDRNNRDNPPKPGAATGTH